MFRLCLVSLFAATAFSDSVLAQPTAGIHTVDCSKVDYRPCTEILTWVQPPPCQAYGCSVLDDGTAYCDNYEYRRDPDESVPSIIPVEFGATGKRDFHEMNVTSIFCVQKRGCAFYDCVPGVDCSDDPMRAWVAVLEESAFKDIVPDPFAPNCEGDGGIAL